MAWTRWTDEQKAIVEFWAGKVPIAVLAGFVDRKIPALLRHCHRNKISVKFKAQSCNLLLLEIKKLKRRGYTNRQVADKLNVDITRIHNTLNSARRKEIRDAKKAIHDGCIANSKNLSILNSVFL